MPRPSNTAERRRQIVDALKRVMAERGFDRAAVSAVGREAELSPGLVHYHFPNKQAILLELVDHLIALVRNRYEARVGAAVDARGRVRAFAEAFVVVGDDADPDAVACWVAIGSEATRQPAVAEAWRAALTTSLDELTELVAAALREAGRDDTDARIAAAGILAAIEGVYLFAAAAPDLLPRGWSAAVVDRIADGLIATANAPGIRL